MSFLSELVVKIVEILVRLFGDGTVPPEHSVLGNEYQRREARRSAIWVFGTLVVLFLLGWWVWRKLTG